MTLYGFVSTMMVTANIAKHVRIIAVYDHQKVREE